MPQTHRHELRPARHLAQLPTTMVGFGQSVEIVSRNQFQKLGEYGIDVGQGSRPFDVSGVSRNTTLAIVCDAEPCDLSNHGTAVGQTLCALPSSAYGGAVGSDPITPGARLAPCVP